MEDKFLKEMMQKSARVVPFLDFESEVLYNIKLLKDQKNSVRNNIRYAWFFFILGIISGVLLVVLLPGFYDNSAILSTGQMLHSSLIIGLFFILFYMGKKLVRFTFRH